MTSDTGAGQKPVIDGGTPSVADSAAAASSHAASSHATSSHAASEAPETPGPTPDPSAVEPPAAAIAAQTRAEEWTASDARGELKRAAEAEALAAASARAAADTPPDGTPPETTVGPDPVPVPAPVPRRSVWPLAAALVVGAAIGAGSAILMQGPLGATLLGQPVGGAPAVADLSNRVDALEKRPDASAAVSGLRGALADLDSKVTALQKNASDQKPAQAVDLTPLDQKIAALQTEVAAVKSQAAAAQGDRSDLDAKLAALQKDVDAARAAGDAAKTGVAGLKDEQKTMAAAAVAPALAVVADSLVRQVHEGASYAAQVDALTSLGADPAQVAVLREHAATGVTPARVLATRFGSLAAPLAALGHKAPPDAGFVDKLKAGMFNLVTVRRVGDTNAADAGSRVARIEADLAHDDVVDAYAAWSALPDDAKSKSAEFGQQLKASAEAVQAARTLQHDAIVGLGRKS